MARTFISQPTQVFNSETYNDAFATGSALSGSATNIQDDLNALRTQVRQTLWASAAGNWYDGVLGVSNLTVARGLNTINSAVTNIEFHKFLYDVQSLGFVQVPSGSNFVSLTVSGSTAPSGLAAVGLGTVTGSFTGSVVATLPGLAGAAHSLNLISGTQPTFPRNLCIIRDAFTHGSITDPIYVGHEIYGFLQIESAAVDGQAFSDTTPGRTQISFVVEFQSGTFVPATISPLGISGRTINYQYRARTTYSGLPEDAYLNTVFVDVSAVAASGSGAQLSDITLQKAINNQGGVIVSDASNTTIDLGGSGTAGSWTYMSGSKTLWKLLAGVVPGTSNLAMSADSIEFSSSNPTSFTKGLQVATGSSEIDIGIKTGMIQTMSGTNLILSGGAQLMLSDLFGPTSTYTGGQLALATGGSDWNTFFTSFGQTSILGAFNLLSSSISGSVSPKRSRVSAGTTVGGTTGIAPNTNVTFPTNLDAPLLSYVGRDFTKDLNIYLNGILLFNGFSITNPNDVYPGTTASTGDLMFPMKLRSGSIITMERF